MSWSSSSLICCAHAQANSSTLGKSPVRASQIRELQGFVGSLERDKAAVVAGLTLPQNNGVVEGKVEFAQTHQADDVRESSISAVTSACSSCLLK